MGETCNFSLSRTLASNITPTPTATVAVTAEPTNPPQETLTDTTGVSGSIIIFNVVLIALALITYLVFTRTENLNLKNKYGFFKFGIFKKIFIYLLALSLLYLSSVNLFQQESYNVSAQSVTTFDGYVYEDENENEALDEGETTFANVRVLLQTLEGTQVAHTTTDENGMYQFSVTEFGQYKIEIDNSEYESDTLGEYALAGTQGNCNNNTVALSCGLDLQTAVDTDPVNWDDTVNYTYTIENTSNSPVNNLVLYDSGYGTITCPDTEIGIGETVQCTHTETEPVSSTSVQLTGIFDEGEVCSQTSSTSTNLSPNPTISIVADMVDQDPGNDLYWEDQTSESDPNVYGEFTYDFTNTTGYNLKNFDFDIEVTSSEPDNTATFSYFNDELSCGTLPTDLNNTDTISCTNDWIIYEGVSGYNGDGIEDYDSPDTFTITLTVTGTMETLDGSQSFPFTQSYDYVTPVYDPQTIGGP